MIITSDWHLDDDPANAYRWLVFDALKREITKGERVIYMLGDLCDKKDRHSAELVNKLLNAFRDLCSTASGVSITIMLGNHDKALRGLPFWWLFNYSDMPISFIDMPWITKRGDLMLLPYSHDPAADWADLPFDGIKAVFMHQTLTGAKAEGAAHRVMEGKPGIPLFPPGLKIYSGDIHLPQIVKWGSDVTYVGAPHLVRFGDDHCTRMLRLDESSYEITEELLLDPPRKLVVACGSLQELRDSACKPGDRIRVRITLGSDQIEQWPVEELEIRQWAKSKGVEIASIEPIIEQHVSASADQPVESFDNDPLAVLGMFADKEGLDPGLRNAAEQLLKGEIGV